MVCRKCGNNSKEEFRFCPQCGSSLKEDHSSLKKFFFTAGFFILFISLLFSSQTSLAEVVENHLSALRQNKITEAYYAYVSKEFQKEIPLTSFRKLVSAIPALKKNQGAHFIEEKINDEKGTLIGILQSPLEKTLVQYDLVKEDNSWKIRNILLENSAPTIAVVQPGTSVDWLRPIDLFLRALRDKNISQAYQIATSQDFQEATSLENFEEFIQKNPILANHTEIVITAQSVAEKDADVTITLDPENEAIVIRFLLAKVGNEWKIWNLSMVSQFSETVKELIDDPKTMRKPVEGMLMELRRDEIPKGFHEYTSRDFKKKTPLEAFRRFVTTFPILQEYEAIEFKEPVLSKTTGLMDVNFHDKKGKHTFEFTLGIEDGQWKIWGIQVVTQVPKTTSSREIIPDSSSRLPLNEFNNHFQGTERLEEDEETPSTSTLSFTKAEVGKGLNLKGEVVEPSSTLKSPHGEIYVNLYIENGVERARINIDLEHVESHSSLPTISTTLQQSGESRISFALSPPPQGWPIGRYKMRVRASTGSRRTFNFQIE